MVAVAVGGGDGPFGAGGKIPGDSVMSGEKWLLPWEVIAANDDWLKVNTYEALRDRQYHHYYSLIREFKVDSVFEIGVRAGYSMYAMLAANPRLVYRGLEINHTETLEYKFLDHARELAKKFPEADVRIIEGDSLELERLPRRFDLIHVDGNHSYRACSHDMEVCAPMTDLLVVDDYDYIDQVKRAVDDFVKKHSISSRYIPSFRGNKVLFTESIMREFK